MTVCADKRLIKTIWLTFYTYIAILSVPGYNKIVFQ